MLQDINNVLADFKGISSKLDLALDFLKDHRFQLCAFHTTKHFSFGKTSSQLSECQNSQIKGGNSYSRWLRCQSYVETITHIVASMQIYIDETIARIKCCVAAKHQISTWVYEKLKMVSFLFHMFIGIPEIHLFSRH